MVRSFSAPGTLSLRGQRNPFVAHEGLPLLALAAALVVFCLRYFDAWLALLPLIGFVLLFLLFRDPRRFVPPVALGIVSPVDGEVVAVDTTNRCVVQGDAHFVRIRIDLLGTYTARSPIEGRVMDLHSKAEGLGPDCPTNALWLETDEGDSVVLQFQDYRLGLPPKSFIRLGERVGQGQRCAYVRLARYADLYLPLDGKVHVEVGQKLVAGTDVIGAVPHP
jgi:phosphatidylserine decarboxylase